MDISLFGKWLMTWNLVQIYFCQCFRADMVWILCLMAVFHSKWLCASYHLILNAWRSPCTTSTDISSYVCIVFYQQVSLLYSTYPNRLKQLLLIHYLILYEPKQLFKSLEDVLSSSGTLNIHLIIFIWSCKPLNRILWEGYFC